MGNCLVTKLKGTVDNDNLPKFGKIVVGSLMTGSDHWYMLFARQTTLKCLNGTFISTGTSEKTFNVGEICYSGNEIQLSDPNDTIADIEIPKYSSEWTYNRLIAGTSADNSVDASFLEYVNGTTDISFDGISPGSTIIKNFKIEYVAHLAEGKSRNTGETNVYIRRCCFDTPLDLTDMHRYIPESTVILIFTHTTNVTGTLDGVGSCINITNIYVPSDKRVSLDLVNFVTNARNAGKTTGSVNVYAPALITIKVNGETITPIAQDMAVLAWTADSITFQGSPVNV